MRVQSLGWKIPWRRKWQPTPVFLPGKSHGQRSLVGYSPWGCSELDNNLATKQQQSAKWLEIEFQCILLILFSFLDVSSSLSTLYFITLPLTKKYCFLPSYYSSKEHAPKRACPSSPTILERWNQNSVSFRSTPHLFFSLFMQHILCVCVLQAQPVLVPNITKTNKSLSLSFRAIQIHRTDRETK